MLQGGLVLGYHFPLAVDNAISIASDERDLTWVSTMDRDHKQLDERSIMYYDCT